ncbi:hypothetical protein NP590_10915 [Methylomonas sp. SURF-2]|uniref:Uncharacterized protein n=1 Tax=Methylomonas subterranea TaxID=2952225 RepID=A0ABT1TGN2_9GAMM|nr:hypothetical protein [Methylomonas sp. SURF-2]MCQ8104617.1 hypothetical protein [Methylomonas sp. SURF-2]
MKLWACLVGGLLLFGTAFGDDSDTETESSRKLIFREGKLILEEHEIEVYDYHTGTMQTFKVYREPEKKAKEAQKAPAPESGPR